MTLRRAVAVLSLGSGCFPGVGPGGGPTNQGSQCQALVPAASPPPEILELGRRFIETEGGETLVIVGKNFGGTGARVLLGRRDCRFVSVIGETAAVCTTPPMDDEGPLDVVFENGMELGVTRSCPCRGCIEVVDSRPPKVIEVDPPVFPAAPVETSVRVTFNEPVSAATIRGTTFFVAGPGSGVREPVVPGAVFCDAACSAPCVPGDSTPVICYTPSESLVPSARYTVFLSGEIEDARGHRLDGTFGDGEQRHVFETCPAEGCP